MHAALRALGVYEPALQLEMTVEVPMTDELRMRLLWHAKHVEAVAPAGLRSQLVARAEAAARTYRVQSWPPKPA